MNKPVRPQEADVPPFRMSVAFLRGLEDAALLPDDARRYELIDGELLMAPAPGPQHQFAEQNLSTALWKALIAAGLSDALTVQSGGGFQIGDYTLLSPDLMVMTRPQEPRAHKAPDIVLMIEIAWSTLDRDLNLKANRYALAEIEEYWVLDVPARAVIVHRTPREGRYASIETLEEPATVSPLRAPQLSLTIKDFF